MHYITVECSKITDQIGMQDIAVAMLRRVGVVIAPGVESVGRNLISNISWAVEQFPELRRPIDTASKVTSAPDYGDRLFEW